MSVIFTETFGTGSGSDWKIAQGADHDWTTQISGGGTLEIAAGLGRIATIGSSGSAGGAIAPHAPILECDLLVSGVTYEEATNHRWVMVLRGDGAWGDHEERPLNGYTLHRRVDSTSNNHFARNVDGVETQLGDQFVWPTGAGSSQAGVAENHRFQVITDNGSVILRLKAWEVGDPEPENWQVTRTDNTPITDPGVLQVSFRRRADTNSLTIAEIRLTDLATGADTFTSGSNLVQATVLAPEVTAEIAQTLPTIGQTVETTMRVLVVMG